MLRELNQVVQLIEDNVREVINLDEWFESNRVDAYNFKIVFFHLTGLSLNEYIRKRRLYHAHHALQNGASVTEVAYAFQYQSLDGFTRAFKSEYAYLPSVVHTLNKTLVVPPFQFNIEVKGGQKMDYKIVALPKFNFVGVSARVPMQFEGVNTAIVELAQSITQEQGQELHRVRNMELKEILNISYEADYEFKEEKGLLSHMIGVMSTMEDIDPILSTYPVEECLWAVFPNEGKFPEVMQETSANIYSQWLASSEYDILPYPNFSFTKMKEEGNEAYCEIWIPVKHK